MAKKKDTWTKTYMENTKVFADVFNFLIYKGKQVICPEKLHSLNTTVIGAPYGADGAGVPVQKFRDVLKYMVAMEDDTAAYLLFGVENQSEIHYAMPVRNMVYDALQYAAQVDLASKSHRKEKNGKKPSTGEYLSGFYKEDRLLPVITVVIYFGASEWDGPMSIYDMLSISDEELLSFIPNYKINLIAPANLTEEIAEQFHTDIREVMLYIKYSKDKEKLTKLLASNDKFQKMDRITAETINAVTGSKLKFSEDEEVVNMCKAIDDIRKEERAEGKIQEKKETAFNLYHMGMKEDFIAKAINVNVDLVKQWLGLTIV